MSEDDKVGRAGGDGESGMWALVSREGLIAGRKEDGRTVYRREGKKMLVAAASVPGMSVARIARDHGLNANQLHAWIRLARRVTSERGAKARLAKRVSTGLERAARSRVEHVGERAAAASPPGKSPSPSLRLVPVEMTEAAPLLSGSVAAALVIEISGARIVVQGGVIDRAGLRAVIECLRESDHR